jgi:uncharacterized protein (DUF2336 family)
VHRSASLPFNSHRAAGRPERLLRASVTAFCSLTRPTRREIVQLDDLAVPLLSGVSEEALRFVAAALCESPYAPPVLVRRLADRPIEIAAPLLMSSPVLTNIDLVALIGRHGLPHARAISMRADLDERILRLIRSLGALDAEAATDKAEETRARLLTMMRPAAPEKAAASPVSLHWDGEPGAYRKLRSTALAGVSALFHTALADVLGIDLARAEAITDDPDIAGFIVALRSLSLSDEQALLLVQCVRPMRSGDTRAIAAFLDAYAAVTPDTAARLMGEWRNAPLAANRASQTGKLKAS